MNVAIIGCGRVGLVAGACFAEIGHDVLCLDTDVGRVTMLSQGELPVHEPGLKDLVDRNRATGRLRFTADAGRAAAHGAVHFLTVDTPEAPDGAADVSNVLEAARQLGRDVAASTIVVTKSTVPVGTSAQVLDVLQAELVARHLRPDVAIASNPEFLTEGAAVSDFMRPARIIIGADAGPTGERAQEALRTIYAPLGVPARRMCFMGVRDAEFTKYAANAMLATRVSFINELANLADRVGVDIEQVRAGIGADPRIGPDFLRAGMGYGGSCFPKDIQALVRTATQAGCALQVLEAVDRVNALQLEVLLRKVLGRFGDDLAGRTFCVWGLAFKADTDDMRRAPSLFIVRELLARGAHVVAHDPIANAAAQVAFERALAAGESGCGRLSFADSQRDAAAGADALVVLTEAREFRDPDFADLKARLKTPVIFDGRNLYPRTLRSEGFEYFAIGH